MIDLFAGHKQRPGIQVVFGAATFDERKLSSLISGFLPSGTRFPGVLQNYTNVKTEEVRDFYTVKQIAERWQLSTDFVQDFFREHPDVMRFPRPETRKKRGYLTLRVPRATLLATEARQTRAKAA